MRAREASERMIEGMGPCHFQGGLGGGGEDGLSPADMNGGGGGRGEGELGIVTPWICCWGRPVVTVI